MAFDIAQLDHVDLQIIQLLAETPNQSSPALAQKIGMAGVTIRTRASRLAEAGLLVQQRRTGSTAKIRPSYLLSIAPNAPIKDIEEATKLLSGKPQIAAITVSEQPPIEQRQETREPSDLFIVLKALAERIADLDKGLSDLERRLKIPGTDSKINGDGYSLANRLLEKFPDFNSCWSQENQSKWFQCYERLLSLSEAIAGNN